MVPKTWSRQTRGRFPLFSDFTVSCFTFSNNSVFAHVARISLTCSHHCRGSWIVGCCWCCTLVLKRVSQEGPTQTHGSPAPLWPARCCSDGPDQMWYWSLGAHSVSRAAGVYHRTWRLVCLAMSMKHTKSISAPDASPQWPARILSGLSRILSR